MKAQLQEVLNLLKSGWIKGSYAGKKLPETDKEPYSYRSRYVRDEDADCFCTMGAINKVGQNDPHLRMKLATAVAACIKQPLYRTAHFENAIVNFNDLGKTTREDVLEVVQCAIDHENAVPQTTDPVSV